MTTPPFYPWLQMLFALGIIITSPRGQGRANYFWILAMVGVSGVDRLVTREPLSFSFWSGVAFIGIVAFALVMRRWRQV